MGSRLALAYANTFTGKLEKNILDMAKYKPKYYRRFIDDILIIFEHSETELDNFMTHMNNANRAIKFTHEKNSPLSHSWMLPYTKKDPIYSIKPISSQQTKTIC